MQENGTEDMETEAPQVDPAPKRMRSDVNRDVTGLGAVRASSAPHPAFPPSAVPEHSIAPDRWTETMLPAVLMMMRCPSLPTPKTSKRSWKEAWDKTNKSGKKPTSWEKKMAEKAKTKAYRETKDAAIEAFKAKQKEVADKRKAAAVKKEENRKKAEVVQVIKNPATLKKMMKNRNMKKRLVTRDTN